MKRRLTSLSIGAGVLAIALLLAAGSGPALASSPPTDEESASLPLTHVADLIDDAAAKSSPNGSAGIEIHPESTSISVYWKGEPPTAVQEVINSQTDVHVNLIPAKFSLEELDSAMREIMPAYEPSKGTSDYAIQRVEEGIDGSGLIVAARKFTDEKRKELLANPYVKSLTTDAPTGRNLTRQNDSSPWYAGGRMRVDGANPCSTGFALENADGTDYLLSAAHCDSASSNTVRDGTYSDVLGSVSYVYGSVDALLINVSGSAMGRMFDGARNESPTSYQPVRGSSGSHKGDYLCASGSYAGIRCNLKVIDMNIGRNVNGFTVIQHSAQQVTAGGVAAANGDSGGPVITNSPSQVYARGLISQYEPGTSVSCGSGVASGTTCWNKFWYTPISTIMSKASRTLMTKTS